MPMILFLPVVDDGLKKKNIYECPMYKVLSRQGTLSTTGHSTNFVLKVDIPTNEDQDKWIKAGVALFLSLKE
jgi:dynein heavy chain